MNRYRSDFHITNTSLGAIRFDSGFALITTNYLFHFAVHPLINFYFSQLHTNGMASVPRKISQEEWDRYEPEIKELWLVRGLPLQSDKGELNVIQAMASKGFTAR